MPQLRITAIGLIPSAALFAGVFLLPQLLAGSLTDKEAEARVAAVYSQRATQALLDRTKGLSSSAADRQIWEAEVAKLRPVRLASLRVRRGLLVPPFSRRTTFLIEARLSGTPEAEYFKVRGSSIYNVGSFWWHLRL